MSIFFTYKISDYNNNIVYVGYTKQPWAREFQHLQSKNARFDKDLFKFQILDEYKNEYEARYNEEKLKRQLGLSGEMGDKRFQKYQNKFG